MPRANTPKVKLSGRSDMTKNGPSLCWAGVNTLAILTGELMVRMWDLHTGDTYVLAPAESVSTGNLAAPQEVCTSLSFCKTAGNSSILNKLPHKIRHTSEKKTI